MRPLWGRRSSRIPFIPNIAIVTSVQPIAIRTGSLRAPNSNSLAFVIQSFIDELAHAAGKDPLEFRMACCRKTRPVRARRLGGGGGGGGFSAERAKGVLQMVAEMSNWGKRIASQRAPRGASRSTSAIAAISPKSPKSRSTRTRRSR